MFGQAESPTGKLARWVSKMQPFKPFNVKCQSGSNSDVLSRELRTGQFATICKDVGQVVQDVPGALGPTGTKGSKAADNQDNSSTQENAMQALEKMGMDLIGPLPKSKQGHVYALVIQDYFTKWPKAIPLKDATTKSVAGALLLVILMWGSSGTPQWVQELRVAQEEARKLILANIESQQQDQVESMPHLSRMWEAGDQVMLRADHKGKGQSKASRSSLTTDGMRSTKDGARAGRGR